MSSPRHSNSKFALQVLVAAARVEVRAQGSAGGILLEHDLAGKPVSTLGSVSEGRLFFRIML
jgi:hypothetical protein